MEKTALVVANVCTKKLLISIEPLIQPPSSACVEDCSSSKSYKRFPFYIVTIVNKHGQTELPYYDIRNIGALSHLSCCDDGGCALCGGVGGDGGLVAPASLMMSRRCAIGWLIVIDTNKNL